MLLTLPKIKKPKECMNTVVSRLQDYLMKEATKTFGPRSGGVKLDLPKIVNGSEYPEVQFSYDKLSAYANLTDEAGERWENMVYQLAHELVHLLDPRPRHPDGPGATWFEEAIATSFGRKYLHLLAREVWEPKNEYEYAYKCVTEAGTNHLYLAGKLRQEYGHLSDIPEFALESAFKCRPEISKQLSQRFHDQTRIA